MTLQTNVVRRGAKYHFRARVPADLQERCGRREIWRALRTSEPITARERSVKVAAATNRAFQIVRMNPTLDKDQIAQLVAEYVDREIAADDAERAMRSKQDLNVVTEEAISTGDVPEILMSEVSIELELQEWQECLRREDWDRASPIAEQLLSETGETLPPESSEFRHLCHYICRAKVDIAQKLLSRFSGNYDYQSGDPFIASLPTARGAGRSALNATTLSTRSPHSQKGIGEIFLMYRKEQESLKRGLAPKTLKENARSIALFEEIVGSKKPIASITTQDVQRFKEHSAELPQDRGGKLRRLPFRDRIKIGRERELPKLSTETRHKHLSAVRTLLSWAEDNNIIAESPANKVRIPLNKSDEAKRDVLRPSQLDAIFHSPLYTGCKSEHRIYTPGSCKVRDHRFWVPLIALYSGARLGEICQLELADVQTLDTSASPLLEQDELWWLDITDVSESEEAAKSKRLKSRSARRKVPVHSHLMKFGFSEYVTSLRSDGKRRLFPKLELGADGYYSTFSSCELLPNRWTDRAVI